MRYLIFADIRWRLFDTVSIFVMLFQIIGPLKDSLTIGLLALERRSLMVDRSHVPFAVRRP